MAAAGTATTHAQRCAVLHPAVAEAARRAGAGAVGLVDVGPPSGLNLHLDRVGITYGNGQHRGDPTSPVQLTCVVRGDRRLPEQPLPPVRARVAVAPDRAAPEPTEAPSLPAVDPPLLLVGDAVALLTEAVHRVPADALPVVTTTWAMSRFSAAGRLRFLHRLEEAAGGRAVAWVSVEGVGVAPEVPTLGDRPASGHSIVGLTTVDGAARRSEAVGRCWGRGRWLAWLADS
jgi:hypothetical protein